jgi:hypothetical protein
MRRGFSLFTAIVVILLIGTVLWLSLSLSGYGVAQTTDLYLREQVRLYAKSFVEYEMLKVSGFDFSGGCYTGNNYDKSSVPALGNFEINTTIKYLGSGFDSGCTLSGLVTADSNGTALIDVVVSYRDPDDGRLLIRYHRRTVQKP